MPAGWRATEDSRVHDQRHRRVRREHDVVGPVTPPCAVGFDPGRDQDGEEARGEDDICQEDEEGIWELRLVVRVGEGVGADLGFVVVGAGETGLVGLLPLGLLLSGTGKDGDAEYRREELRNDANGWKGFVCDRTGCDAEGEGGEEAGDGYATEDALVGHGNRVEEAIEAGG